tara:strand:+ start:5906 stop:6166 length:261 start_codon:yes stop_codon:yes gene_type:complete
MTLESDMGDEQVPIKTLKREIRGTLDTIRTSIPTTEQDTNAPIIMREEIHGLDSVFEAPELGGVHGDNESFESDLYAPERRQIYKN